MGVGMDIDIWIYRMNQNKILPRPLHFHLSLKQHWLELLVCIILRSISERSITPYVNSFPILGMKMIKVSEIRWPFITKEKLSSDMQVIF